MCVVCVWCGVYVMCSVCGVCVLWCVYVTCGVCVCRGGRYVSPPWVWRNSRRNVGGGGELFSQSEGSICEDWSLFVFVSLSLRLTEAFLPEACLGCGVALVSGRDGAKGKAPWAGGQMAGRGPPWGWPV